MPGRRAHEPVSVDHVDSRPPVERLPHAEVEVELQATLPDGKVVGKLDLDRVVGIPLARASTPREKVEQVVDERRLV